MPSHACRLPFLWGLFPALASPSPPSPLHWALQPPATTHPWSHTSREAPEAGSVLFYLPSDSGHSVSSSPSCECRQMVPKWTLTAVYRREAEEERRGVERKLDWKSRPCLPNLHWTAVGPATLRKYPQARPQFPYQVMRGLL